MERSLVVMGYLDRTWRTCPCKDPLHFTGCNPQSAIPLKVGAADKQMLAETVYLSDGHRSTPTKHYSGSHLGEGRECEVRWSAPHSTVPHTLEKATNPAQYIALADAAGDHRGRGQPSLLPSVRLWGEHRGHAAPLLPAGFLHRYW